MEKINWTETGNIFDIQRFSLHDGPGIRTIVFLKGCSLRCKWCSNPESQSSKKEIFLKNELCIGCGECKIACPENIIEYKNNKVIIDREKCTGCGKCEEACCSGAITVIGKSMSVEEVFYEIRKDTSFYKSSGGGVTLSGGEAILQSDFAKELLKACKAKGINTAIETAGNYESYKLKNLMEYVDLFLYDLKIVDSNIHKKYTGDGNEKIIENLNLISKNKDVIIRVPLISNINENLDNIDKTMNFAKATKTKTIHLLSYHKYGTRKYKYLDREYLGEDFKAISEEKLNVLKEYIIKSGVNCVIGG